MLKTGLWLWLSSRDWSRRCVHGQSDRSKWSMARVFEIAGPAASCTYCFNDTTLVPLLPLCFREPGDPARRCHSNKGSLEVEVMSRAMPIVAVISELSISELLVFLTGYTVDLGKMAFLGFLHDNHLENLLVVTSLTGAKKITWHDFWHDFGTRSYFHSR